MANEEVSLQPDIGVMLTAYYGSHRYSAKVIKHGRKYPTVVFWLKNGRRVEKYATVIEHDAHVPDEHRGVLCRMFHPTAYDR